MRFGRALAAIALGALGAPAAADATFPGATGLLAFQSDRAGDYGIWTSNADGSNPQPLYDPPGTHEFNPAWSLSGNELVVQAGPLDRSTFDLVLVDVVTREATPLLDGPENDRAAQFCDPSTIVFTRQADPANADIWRIGTDGTGLTQLTNAPGIQSFPTCSPNSARIAYISNQTGVPAIWEMNADGSNQHQVVAGLDPDYSPDWETLTYAAADPADGNPEIFELDRETGETTQVTHTPPSVQNRLPHYAPEYPDGPVELYFTQLDPGLAFPEQNVAILADPGGNATAFCGNPPPGPPGVDPNAPPGDPGGPKNNSAIAAQPAAGCQLSQDGTLTVQGTEGPDTIHIRETGDRTIVVEVNGTEKTYPGGSVTGIRIFGNGGDDRISEGLTGVSVPMTADGGAGIDVVFGEVTIDGTANADRVQITTVEDDDDPAYGTTITLNGQSVVFGPGVDVNLVGFDRKDTVVTDRFTHVTVNGFISILPEIFMSRANPIVRVTGTPENDRIDIKLDKTATFRISLNGQQAPGITGIFGLVRTDVAGQGGEDKIATNIRYNRLNRPPPRLLGAPLMPVRIEGGPGGDRITCRGAAQTCTVLAGPGNDTVDVRDGTRSVVDAGPGFDRLSADRGDRVRRAEVVASS
jgi:hypothetical protein